MQFHVFLNFAEHNEYGIFDSLLDVIMYVVWSCKVYKIPMNRDEIRRYFKVIAGTNINL